METSEKLKALQDVLDKAEQVEICGAMSAKTPMGSEKAKAAVQEYFQIIRSDPPRAYIQFMKMGLQARDASTAVLLGRMAGLAMAHMLVSDDLFRRVMAENESITKSGLQVVQ